MKKRLKKWLLALGILTIIIIVPISYPPLMYRKETNTNNLPQDYLKGVFHIHSKYSDGKGTVNDITKAASNLNLDFVLLTDHGTPNIQSSIATAFSNGVLLIGGSEFSLHSGHLACAGFKLPNYILPPEPQEAINEVLRDDGICFLAHPNDSRIPWTNWNIENPTGLEILSSYSCAQKISKLKLIIFPFQYFINSNYALASTLEYPQDTITEWNQLNTRANGNRYYGIYALDAHAKLPITQSYSLGFPTYQAMFQTLQIYVKTKRTFTNEMTSQPDSASARQAASEIIESLKKGNFFNVIEAMAPANGFRVDFIDCLGNSIEMGSSTKCNRGTMTIHTPFLFPTTIQIKRNGTIYKTFPKNKNKTIQTAINDPGFYTIEVFIPNHSIPELPWIISNPFYLGKWNNQSPGKLKTNLLTLENSEWFEKKNLTDSADSPSFFKIEKNTGSQTRLSYTLSPENESIYSMEFTLRKDPGNKNFWCALAARRNFDFSKTQGIAFEIKSTQRQRLWIEFRMEQDKNNEIWFRHSFLAEPEWQRYYIRFTQFPQIIGNQYKGNFSDITSLFFSINNANAYPNTSGKIWIKKLQIH